jgi:adenylosuccinate synthase
MKITRKQLQDIIIKESAGLGMRLGASHRPAQKKKSQIHEFSATKSGKRVAEAGQKIKRAGDLIREVAADQVGAMAASLNNIAEFVEKMGNSLSGLNELKEDSSLTETLPTVQEFKKVLKEIQKLEK